jgi:hypothetical protein
MIKVRCRAPDSFILANFRTKVGILIGSLGGNEEENPLFIV